MHSPSNTPFSEFAPFVRPASDLRQAITAHCRTPEVQCLAPLLKAATMNPRQKEKISATTQQLIKALRAGRKNTGVESLIQEYSLSSEEGVALMCLAEALLRIPDSETRDALIRDKISDGKWSQHLGVEKPLFVNAATWGLVITGKLVNTANEHGLSHALARLLSRAGEPVVRRGVNIAMRLMGEQFVTGETIAEALSRATHLEQRGYRYSYDMLGEAASTAEDAARYYASYENAIHAIGKASQLRGIYEGPGISIKLSALHPRYSRAQVLRVMNELLPRVKALCLLAKSYDIGLNIDAEEADRLELSLDLMEDLCCDAELGGWNGLGFVVQAYGKRCPVVIDYIVDLAKRSNRRIMVRLVKGAYWDAEIKRAQVDGLEGFPVFTRKVYTDVSYIACARKLLDAKDFVFPQFATHNAQSLATILHLAGPAFAVGDYEFQCLHGMGEPLYDEVVGPEKLNRPCRIYAPVGTHETLLAYLVRRLLENGANTSFVNRIGDPAVSLVELCSDPVDLVLSMGQPGAVHVHIQLPANLFAPVRKNSNGIDLSNEKALLALSSELRSHSAAKFEAQSLVVHSMTGNTAREILNPGNANDHIGTVWECNVEDAHLAARAASLHHATWQAVAPTARADILEKAAELLERDRSALMVLLIREAGKTAANAISELREAIDFLNFYAAEARHKLSPRDAALGPVVCISPWNFPLAIFLGQIAAALVAGNVVLAKPAEETPLIAAKAVSLLHEAGIPAFALQLLLGDGLIGAALVAAPETQGVIFTGSTDVARLIQRQLSQRLNAHNKPIPLIAETGGQNAMIVDSSALAEQVSTDVIYSAFDSAGQRCSALRVLCLQDDIADRFLNMIKGAMAELVLGDTDQLRTDIGPLISAEAKQRINRHITHMRAKGFSVFQVPQEENETGYFVPPILIEINGPEDLENEVFGPVLHVLRFKRTEMNTLVERINATGYGLTFGLHTRIDETIDAVSQKIKAGNIYINRNTVGAVVGVQPFGGSGLSGTGPKAGGALYLSRLVQSQPNLLLLKDGIENPVLESFLGWLEKHKGQHVVSAVRAMTAQSPLGFSTELVGPVGESNVYTLHPKGRVLLLPVSEFGLLMQVAAVLATGNHVVLSCEQKLYDVLGNCPRAALSCVQYTHDWKSEKAITTALIEGDEAHILQACQNLAQMPGPIILPHIYNELEIIPLHVLMEEVVVTTNTTASGGNASLMTLEA